MRHDLINSDWLRTFCALAETQNFTKTASLLHMTQPGVSQHIFKLEQYLNKTLIIREGKSFELTPHGVEVLNYAQDLLHNEQLLKEKLGDVDPFSGTCRISMPGGVGNLVYPWLIDLQVKLPKLKIHIQFNPTKIVDELVRNNECDIGLVTHNPDTEVFNSQAFLYERLWLVLPMNNTSEGFHELQKLGFVDHPDGKKMAAKVLPVLYPDEFTSVESLSIAAYTNSAPKICHHVGAGIGYTVLDEFMVRLSSEYNKLHIVNSVDIPSDEIRFIYKKKWPLHPRHQYVMDYLVERAKLFRTENN